MREKVTVQSFADALGMENLISSINGATPCSGIMSLYTEDDGKKAAETEVTGVTYNSKEAGPGYLFVVKGAHFKEEYLDEAVKRGAVCYVREEAASSDAGECSTGAAESSTGGAECNIDAANGSTDDAECSAGVASKSKVEFAEGEPVAIGVKDIRKAMPIIAETFYGKLSDTLTVIGITGTKGKSTTTYYMRYILDDWMAATGGKRSAVCSGIDNYDGVIEEESHLTSPEIMELYQHMNNAIESGITYMTMEVSSQALKYDRVTGVNLAAGALLNIGSDHISPLEHPDFDDYKQAKLRIFEHCRKACYSLESDELESIKEASKNCPYVITFSQKDESADVFGYDIKSVEGKVSFKVRGRGIEGYDDFDEEITLGTFGTINIENALAAVSLSALVGVPMEYVKSGLAKAKSPGRMEVFYSEDGKRIAIVDYAHNKLSYERFFDTMKDEFPGKKMIIVFGCPGLKALARREELGTIAGERCEFSIITEEDYGEEDVNKICAEIAGFVEAAGGMYDIITDRVEAIKKAITMMDDETILFLPGKGRETREKRGNAYIDTPSDVEVVEKYL